MKKITLFIAITLLGAFAVQAQKYMTRNGHIWFYSHTAIEDIEAHNYQVASVIDAEKGEMVFNVLMKGFQFEKALMQEHFNEKYVESDKFPKATFKGKITNLDAIDLSKAGVYKTEVEGDLTLHGVTKPVKTEGTIEVKEGQLVASAKFQVAVANYDIKIPSVVQDNIAKVMDITVDMTYEPLPN